MSSFKSLKACGRRQVSDFSASNVLAFVVLDSFLRDLFRTFLLAERIELDKLLGVLGVMGGNDDMIYVLCSGITCRVGGGVGTL